MKKGKGFLALLFVLLFACNMQVFASETEVEHVYSAPTKFSWNYDNTCKALVECTLCEETHKTWLVCEVSEEYRASTCTEGGESIYTAIIEIGGTVYSDQKVETYTAIGHSFDDTVCRRCGATRNPASVVTIAKERTVTYCGKAYAIKVQDVEGSTGKVTYKYYLNESCTKLTTSKNSGASKNGGAPVQPGVYYVVATVAADDNYRETVTKPSKLIILPRKVLNYKAVNTSSGIKLTWSKREEADGYIIYARTSPTAKWARVAVLKGKDKTSFLKKDSTNGQKVYYNIVAYGDVYEGNDIVVISNKRSTDTQIIRLALTITNQNGSVKLKWKKCNDTKAKGYYIYRKRSGESKYTRVATISNRSTVSWTDKSSKTVKSGKKAQYYIKVYYGKSHSIVATSATYTNYYLSRPTASKSGDYIKWTKVSGASGYEIYEKNMDFTTYYEVSNTKTKCKVFDGWGQICAKVRAYKKVNGKYYYSAWSKERTSMDDIDFRR